MTLNGSGNSGRRQQVKTTRSMAIRHWACLWLMLLGAALFVPAVAAADQSLTVRSIDASKFPTVRVYVTVTDSRGAAVNGLEAQAFQVQEDRKPIDGVVAESPGPYVAAIVLTVGDSMSQDQKLELSRSAAASFVASLGPGDRAIVVSFGSRVTTIQEYTDNKDALRSAIDSLSTRGDHVLYDALNQTAPRQGTQPESRRPIILLTDGDDSGSQASLDTSISATVSARAPVYVIGLGSKINRDILGQIARVSGGQAYFVASAADLKSTFLSIADLLKSEYALRYTSQVSTDNDSHAVDVQVTNAGVISSGRGTFLMKAGASSSPTQIPLSPQAGAAPTENAAPPITPPRTTGDESSGVVYAAFGILALLAMVVFLAITNWNGPRRRRSERVIEQAPGATPRPPEHDPFDTVIDYGARVVKDGAQADETQIVDDQSTAYFDVTFDNQSRARIRLDHPDTTLGRDPTISDSYHIKLEGDKRVSRDHARIISRSGAHFIQDLGSANGTVLNDQKMSAHTEMRLNTGDRIVVGKWILEFHPFE